MTSLTMAVQTIRVKKEKGKDHKAGELSTAVITENNNNNKNTNNTNNTKSVKYTKVWEIWNELQ